MDLNNIGQWAALGTMVIGVLSYTIKITLAYGSLDRRSAVSEEKINKLEGNFSATETLSQKTYDVAIETNTEVKVTSAKIGELEKRLDRDYNRRKDN